MMMRVEVDKPCGCHAERMPFYRDKVIVLLDVPPRIDAAQARMLASELVKAAEAVEPAVKRLNRVVWVCGACEIQWVEVEPKHFVVRDKGTREPVAEARYWPDAFEAARQYSSRAL